MWSMLDVQAADLAREHRTGQAVSGLPQRRFAERPALEDGLLDP
jgi:hypothetical protein